MDDIKFLDKLRGGSDFDPKRLKFAFHPYQSKGYLTRMLETMESLGVKEVNIRPSSFLRGFTVEAWNNQTNGIHCKNNYSEVFNTLVNLIEGKNAT